MPNLNERQFKVGRVTERPGGFYEPNRTGPTQGQIVTGGHRHPWPRGFSPERRSEVLEAMPPVRGGGYDPDTSKRIRDEMRASAMEGGPGGIEGSPTAMRHNEGHQRRTAEMIARSSVPTEDLRGVSKISWHKPRDITGGVGQYDPADSTIGIAGGEGGGVLPGRESTLVHEIGHHVSRREGNPHAPGMSRDPQQRGQEEGYADRYSAQHARSHPGKDMRASGYPWGQQYYPTGSGAELDFALGYEKTNPRFPEKSANKVRQVPLVFEDEETGQWVHRNPDTGKWHRGGS